MFAGAAFEDADSGDNELFNLYATYETGAWLFAAELNVGEQRVGDARTMILMSLSGLLMANYAYSDVASVTARISMVEIEQVLTIMTSQSTHLRTTMRLLTICCL